MPSKPLSKQEIADINQYLGVRDSALFRLGLYTGFRISELLSLTYDDVTEHGEIINELVIKAKRMKGKAHTRQVVLHNQAKLAINDVIQGLKPGDRLFPISRVQAHRIIKQATYKARVKGQVSTHSMRKTFGQRVYANSGYNVAVAQQALGHKSLASTTAYLAVGQDTVNKYILE